MAEQHTKKARRQWAVSVSVLVIGACVCGTGWSLAPPGEKNPFDPTPSLPSSICSRVGVAGNAQMDELDPAGFSEQMRESKSVGATRIRLGAVWSEIEPSRGKRNWSDLDMRIRAAKDNGLTPLLVLLGAPPWVDLADTTSVDANAKAFGDFAADVARRYGDSIDGYEIWNEPNLSRFWDAPNAKNYAAFLGSAYGRIHAVDSGATVLSGGLAPAGNGAESVAPYDFLQQMYRSGAKEHTDAIGLHPYTFPESSSGTSDWNSFRIMDRMRALLDSAGDGGKKFWLTEYGAPTGGEGGVTQVRQAAMVEEVLDDVARDDSLGPVFLYTLRDHDLGPDDPESYFGILGPGGEKKKAAEVVADLLSECAAAP